MILLQYAFLGARLQAFIREHEGMMEVAKRILDDIKRHDRQLSAPSDQGPTGTP